MFTAELMVEFLASLCSDVFTRSSARGLGRAYLRPLSLLASLPKKQSSRKSSSRKEKVVSTHEQRAGAFDHSQFMVHLMPLLNVYLIHCLNTGSIVNIRNAKPIHFRYKDFTFGLKDRQEAKGLYVLKAPGFLSL
jgi:hypothetical protein